jgi:hypothetical protein
MHVLDGGGVGRQQNGDGSRRRATERPRQPQDRKRAEQAARVDFEVHVRRI